MRLASLNCPNCNAPLREENEKFICTACGSAFALDYDEADVEHERLRTEAEKERIKTQREIELAATRIQLQEESKARQARREREERSERMRSSMKKMIIYPVILMIIASSATFVGIALISMRAMKSSRSNSRSNTNTVSTTQAIRRNLTSDEVLGDRSFTDNALASGLSFAKTSHSENVYDWNMMSELDLNVVPEAKMEGEPKLLNVYFVANGTNNFFIMVYELNYTYVDESIDQTTTVYYADYLADITLTDAGKIQSDYKIKAARGSSIDAYFAAYYDQDQLYREVVLGRGGEVIDLTSDLVSEAEA